MIGAHVTRACRHLVRSPLLLVLGGILTPFVITWARGRLFFDFDMTLITGPIEDLFARYERAGQLPLWAPELQGGYPLIAISHLGFFYPLHALLRLFLPGVVTLNISLLAHALLAAVGMALLLRHRAFPVAAAAFGALVFAGGGFFFGHLYLTNVILPLSWIPLQLWLLNRWLDDRSFPSLVGLSAAGALQILLGQPQAALIGVVVLTLAVASHLLTAPWRTLRRIPGLLCAALLALALSYAQVRPTLDLIPFTDRADAFTEQELYAFSFPLSHVITWAFPHAFGYHEAYIGEKNETELGSWTGVTTLLLAAAGLLTITRQRRREWLFAVLLLTTALCMAGGAASPVYRYLVMHQWITNLAIPARWITLAILALAVSAALGIEHVARQSLAARIRTALISLTTVTVLLGFAWRAMPRDNLPAVMTNLSAAPARSLLPVVATAATLFLFIYPTRAKTLGWALLLVGVGELLPPNIARNPTFPYADVVRGSPIEDILQTAQPGQRVFSQIELTTLPPPRVTPAQLRRLERTTIIRQTFESGATDLLGVGIRMHWGEESPIPGTVTVSLRDLATGAERTLTVTSNDINDKEWLEFRVTPFRGVRGHPFQLSVSSSYDSPGPWVFVARVPAKEEPFDMLPGGSVSFCDAAGCRTPDGPTRAQPPDLFAKILTPEFARIPVAQDILAPHIAASKGYASTQWLGALQLHEMKRVLYAIGDQNENAVSFNPFLARHRAMVDRLGITFLIGTPSGGRAFGSLPGIELAREVPAGDRELRVYRNNQAFPLATFATHVLSVTHPDEALAALQAETLPRDTVVAEDDGQASVLPLAPGTIRLVSTKPTEVVLRTENAGMGYLVLRDTFFPDWQAEIDGKETRIFRTDMVFRGIVVPPGTHMVRFTYTPTRTLRAIRVSLWAWVFTGVAAVWWFVLRRRRALKNTA